MEKVVSELFPVEQFNDEHHTLHAIAMNINAHSVAATRFAMVFMVFSDFAARLKSNSSKFIIPPLYQNNFIGNFLQHFKQSEFYHDSIK